jgi:predicted transcriptional regulator
MAHPGGRPTKYNNKFCEKALKLFEKGLSVVQVAAELNVSRDTIYQWAKVHSEFSDTLAMGIAKAEAFWETILQAGASGANDEPVNPGLLSLIMKCRYHWTETKEVNLTASVDDVTSLSPEDRKRRIAELMQKANV